MPLEQSVAKTNDEASPELFRVSVAFSYHMFLLERLYEAGVSDFYSEPRCDPFHVRALISLDGDRYELDESCSATCRRASTPSTFMSGPWVEVP